MKKGLSVVIGMLIFLIVLISIITPLAVVIFSRPTVEQQQIIEETPYRNMVEQQQLELCPIVPTQYGGTESLINFIYTYNSTAFFIFNLNETPPIPIIVKYILVFNGEHWLRLGITKHGNIYIAEETQQLSDLYITPSDVNVQYNGNPAIMVQLSVTPYQNSPNYVVAVTQYGNILVAQKP